MYGTRLELLYGKRPRCFLDLLLLLLLLCWSHLLLHTVPTATALTLSAS